MRCGRVVEPEPGVVDRGDAGDDGDAVVAHALERLDGMEVVDERDCRARVQREPEHDVEAVDVEERQHAERDVVGGDAQSGVRLHLLDVREQRAVREHGGLRRAGRARGEQQDREIVGAWSRRERLGVAVVGRCELVDDDHRNFPLQRIVGRFVGTGRAGRGAAGEVGVGGGREHEHGCRRRRARGPARATATRRSAEPRPRRRQSVPRYAATNAASFPATIADPVAGSGVARHLRRDRRGPARPARR